MTLTYADENPGPGLEQMQICIIDKLVNTDTFFIFYNNWVAIVKSDNVKIIEHFFFHFSLWFAFHPEIL